LASHNVCIHRNLRLRNLFYFFRLLNPNFHYLRYDLNRFDLRLDFLDDFHLDFLNLLLLFCGGLNFRFVLNFNLEFHFLLEVEIIENLMIRLLLRFYIFDGAVIDFEGWLNLVSDLNDLG